MRPTGLWLAVFLLLSAPFQAASGNSVLELGQNARTARTLIVCPEATEIESGAKLKSALASVTGTAESPYLVKIEPGIYDLGDSYLRMKPFVDIEGSGQGITVIQSRYQAGATLVASSNAEIREVSIVNTFDGDDYAIGIESISASPIIRNVTIEVPGGCGEAVGIESHQSNETMIINVSVHVSGRQKAYGIYDTDGFTYMRNVYVEAASSGAGSGAMGIFISQCGTEETPVRLENVRSIARGGDSAYGMSLISSVVEANKVNCRAEDADYNYGMDFVGSGAVRIANSSTAAKGGAHAIGIRVNNSSPAFTSVSAVATGASADNAGFVCFAASAPKTIRIDHCRISGSSYSIRNDDPDYALYVGASKLDGPISMTGTWHCAHCYDGDNSALDGSCRQ